MSDLHTIHQLAEVGGVHPEVGRKVFLGDHLKEVRAPFDKDLKARFHIKGHQLMLALDHAHQEVFCGLAK